MQKNEQTPQTPQFVVLSSNDWNLHNAKLERLESSVNKVFSQANSNEIFTPSETCKILKTCEKTLANLRKSRRIEFFQFGSNVRFSKAQIEDFISRNSLKIKQ